MTAERKERLLTRLVAGVLPALLFGAVLAAFGVFPFGERSLLIIDLDSEYVDYLALMNETLRSGGSLLRSWRMGMGLGMLGLIAFYTASPFNLIVMLFPVELITEAVFLVTLMKLGLAGFLFSVYADKVFRRRGVFAVVFSVAYAMNAYGVAYASNLMWLDGMALLPLVITGVEKLLRENRWGLFCGSLIYVFLSSYYVGYMIGAFSLLYFLCRWFSVRRELRSLPPKLTRFFGAAVLAAGCCAFLLLPAFLGLQSGQSALWDLKAGVGFLPEKSFLRVLSRLLPGVYDTLTDPGYPGIYCTTLAVFLATQFFLQPVATLREKLAAGCLAGFLLLSFSSGILDLAWHAFEQPTWFPARYSFVLPFLLLSLAMRAGSKAERFRLRGVLGGLLLLAVFVTEIGILRYRYVAAASLLAGVMLPLAYALVWLAGRRISSSGKVLPLLVLLLVSGESMANAWSTEMQLDGQFRYKTRESYTAYREKYRPAVLDIAAHDPGRYRLEIPEQRSANGGMALGYNGISHYSTTTDQNLNRFLRSLGYNRGTVNELRFAMNTPMTNGLLGIKYLLATENPGGGYEAVRAAGGVTAYENLLALPLAFWAPDSAIEWQPDTADPFLLQNSLLSSLSTGLPSAVFASLHAEESLYNVDLEAKEGYLEFSPRVDGEDAVLEYAVDNPEGKELFAYFPVWDEKFATAEVFVGERDAGLNLRYRENGVIGLGSEKEASLALKLSPNLTRIEAEYFYALDLDAATELAEEIQGRAMEIRAFTDTYVEGVINAEAKGALVTTIPYDEGWRVVLDGERVEPERFAGVFLAVPLPAGEHSLAMKYLPPGLLPGSVISGVSLGAILFLWVRKKRRAK